MPTAAVSHSHSRDKACVRLILPLPSTWDSALLCINAAFYLKMSKMAEHWNWADLLGVGVGRPSDTFLHAESLARELRYEVLVVDTDSVPEHRPSAILASRPPPDVSIFVRVGQGISGRQKVPKIKVYIKSDL